MTTQIVMASTAYGLATVVAALDSATLRRGQRCVLVVSTNTAMPEATPELTRIAGVSRLLEAFDAVYHYNAAIEPLHPAGWHPRGEELPMLERYLRGLWGLGAEPVRLAVDSIAVNPALGLCRIFQEAQIEVYGDGLMSYGPTRNALPDTVGVRVERLVHLDLVPGLRPVLLSEWDVEPELIADSAFRAVIASMSVEAGGPGRAERAARSGPVALVLGQYLSANGLLTDAEEVELYTEMIVGAAADHRPVVFKPHPSAPWAHRTRLEQAVRARGVDLSVDDGLELAEAWFERGEVGVVVGCFSTALMTGRSLYGLPTVRHGTELMLSRLAPYQNSNRIPATIVDATVPDLSALETGRLISPPPTTAADPVVPVASGAPALATPVAPATPSAAADPAGASVVGPVASGVVPDLAGLVIAVSYAMQARLLSRRRAEAVAFLQDGYVEHARYFKRRRLTSLDLPGALPTRPPNVSRTPDGTTPDSSTTPGNDTPGSAMPDDAIGIASTPPAADRLPARSLRSDSITAPARSTDAPARQRAVIAAARLRRRLRVPR